MLEEKHPPFPSSEADASRFGTSEKSKPSSRLPPTPFLFLSSSFYVFLLCSGVRDEECEEGRGGPPAGAMLDWRIFALLAVVCLYDGSEPPRCAPLRAPPPACSLPRLQLHPPPALRLSLTVRARAAGVGSYSRHAADLAEKAANKKDGLALEGDALAVRMLGPHDRCRSPRARRAPAPHAAAGGWVSRATCTSSSPRPLPTTPRTTCTSCTVPAEATRGP